MKMKGLRNVVSCILYIIALSFVLVLYGIVEDIISKRYSPPLSDPGYWIEQFQNNVYGFMFFITCQFIAASLIIRNLSLKKLFILTFICIVINHWLETSISSPVLGFFWIFLSIGIAYVIPVLILFFISVKKKPSSEFEAQMQEQAIDNLKNYWYVLDILLIGFILCWGSLPDPFGIVSYISGLYNHYNLFASGFIYALLIVPAFLCLLVIIIRMIVSWPKYISNKRKLRAIQLTVIICLFVFLALPFLPVFPVPKKMYIAGFEGYVKNNADITEIRNWLNSLSQEDFEEYESKERMIKWRDKMDWPEAILKLHPRSAGLSWDKNYKPQVGLSWGSGVVGPWGFVVLNENKSDPEFGISTGIEYRSELKNGVYVWCRSN